MYRSFMPGLGLVISRARMATVALVCAFLLGSGIVPALAAEDGSYVMQCGCPLEWGGDWDGSGVFIEDDSLDWIVLGNAEDATTALIFHEIPREGGSLEDLVERRSASLESAIWVDRLREAQLESDTESIAVGRSWNNANGGVTYSLQFVTVWEEHFLLSIEYVATAGTFVEAWASLEDVLLIGNPVLTQFDPEEIVFELEDL